MTINHAGEFACADVSLSDAMVKPDHVMASLAGKGGISGRQHTDGITY